MRPVPSRAFQISLRSSTPARNRRAAWPIGLATLALVLVAHPARALEEYGSQIPNIDFVPGGCDSLCHDNGSKNSPLYQDWSAAGFVWNATMANADSDGDGFSNGWELQDPFVSWAMGMADPGDPLLVANPANGGSLPPLPVAVVPTPILHDEAAGANGFENFAVQNVGEVSFDYSLSVDESWIAPSVAGGMALPPGMEDGLFLLFMTGGLDGGYMGNLTVAIDGIRPDRIPQVPVTLTVPEPGAVAARTAALLAIGLVAWRRRTRKGTHLQRDAPIGSTSQRSHQRSASR